MNAAPRSCDFVKVAKMDISPPVDTLETVRKTISEVKSSVFTRSASSYTNSKPYRIPIIQEGHCVFVVKDGNESLELVPDKCWSINKIPSHVCEIDDNAYTPRFVSVGPLHYKKPGLEFMEVQKQRLLDRLLERCSHFLIVDALEHTARELEEETREFYSDDFNHIDSDSFVKMMLLDGCVVIELLRLGGRSCQGKLADDPIFATRWMPLNLGLDLLLLENQLPLILLHRLFSLTSSDDESDSLDSLALQFFMTLSPGENDAGTIESHDTNSSYPHLLAMFHSSFTPKGGFQLPAHEGNHCRHIMYAGKGWINDATILKLSGIKFKPKPGNILDIEFKKKELNIPPIFIDHKRATVLRNLVAYEQHDRRAIPYFTSLVVFFSNILCKTNDAKILMKSGIIRQAKNDEEEVVKYFNSIVQDLVFDMNRCYLHNLMEDVNCCSETIWAKLRSILRQIIPRLNVIEIALLIISLVQTFLVVKTYTP